MENHEKTYERWAASCEDVEVFQKALALGACTVCAVAVAGCKEITKLITVSEECIAEEASPCPICCGCVTQLATIVADLMVSVDTWNYVDVTAASPCITVPRSVAVRSAVFVYSLKGMYAGISRTIREFLEKFFDPRSILCDAVAHVCSLKGVPISATPPDVLINVVCSLPEADIGFDDCWAKIDPNKPRRKDKSMHNYKNSKWHTGPSHKGGATDEVPINWPSMSVVNDGLRAHAPEMIPKFGDPLPAPQQRPSTVITTERSALLLAGRYLKYDREMPQTPWLINGAR